MEEGQQTAHRGLCLRTTYRLRVQLFALLRAQKLNFRKSSEKASGVISQSRRTMIILHALVMLNTIAHKTQRACYEFKDIQEYSFLSDDFLNVTSSLALVVAVLAPHCLRICFLQMPLHGRGFPAPCISQGSIFTRKRLQRPQACSFQPCTVY
jgi:hypothetical protein